MTKLLDTLKVLTWDHILPAVAIVAIGLILSQLVVAIAEKSLRKTRLEKAAHKLITSLLRVVCYVLLTLMAASALGIDVTGVVALASVISLAVSLSLQNALTNVIGGFTLLSTHPFKSGDFVEIAGQSGTVQEIGMAYTKLVTPDNKIISLPNSAVVAAQIVNYSTTGTRKLMLNISAAYTVPPAKVVEALLKAAETEYVLQEPAAPFAALTGYGDSAMQYTLHIWVSSQHYWDVNFQVLRNIKDVFDAEGIEMTYPHLNVHLKQ